ncbi:PH domain protein, partial [Ichthyophthirius multifiliis]
MVQWYKNIQKQKYIFNLKEITFFIQKNNEQTEYENKPKLQKNFFFKLNINNIIGISIIDDYNLELFSLTLKNVQFLQSQEDFIEKDHEETKQSFQKQNNSFTIQNEQKKTQYEITKQTQNKFMQFSIDNIFINNSIIDAQFPVIFASDKIKSKYIQINQQIPQNIRQIQKLDTINLETNNISQQELDCESLHLQNYYDNFQNEETNWINYVQIFLDHFELRLDNQVMSSLNQLRKQINKILQSNSKYTKKQANSIFDQFKQLQNYDYQLNKDNKTEKAIYIKQLNIQPINFCFTIKLDSQISNNQEFSFSPLSFLSEFGLQLISIDQANINLNALEQQHLFDTISSIKLRFKKHYGNQFIIELCKIFGYIDVIGNPVKLVNEITQSMSKMFYDPIKALAKGSGKQAFEHFATGAAFLVYNSISHIYDIAKKISGLFMKILARMTFHKQYLQERCIRLNRQIKSFDVGLVVGFKNFISILQETIFGIVLRPIEECQQNRFFGIFIGAYQAIVSIFIKPTVGIYDFIISICDGIKNSAIYEEKIMENRSRPPRIFYNKIQKFRYKLDNGKDILRRLKAFPKQYENIIYYDEIQLKDCIKEIILTNIRLVYVTKNSLLNYQKIMLHKIKKIEYNKYRNQFIFYYDVPVKTFCLRKVSYDKLQYSNMNKAKKLFSFLENHF